MRLETLPTYGIAPDEWNVFEDGADIIAQTHVRRIAVPKL